MRKNHGRAGRGVTLIELLVVISIIIILLGLLMPALAAARRYAKNASTKATIHNLEIALTNYKQEWGLYPLDPAHPDTPHHNMIHLGGPQYFDMKNESGNFKAKGVASDGSESNAKLTKSLLDGHYLDTTKANLAGDNMKDHFGTSLCYKFLVVSPTVGDTDKIGEKAYIWSYGNDRINNVAADPGYAYQDASAGYDNDESNRIEGRGGEPASPETGSDDVAGWAAN